MKWGYIYLFLSGFFFGGTVDHIIFAIRGTPAPYGVKLGMTGNVLMAIMDLVVAAILLIIFKRKIIKSSK